MSSLGPGARGLLLVSLVTLLAFADPPSRVGPPSAPALLRARANLGALLFKSPLLSSSGSVSCATCHDPAHSFSDGLARSLGELGVEAGRNAPALFALARVARFPDPLGFRKFRPDTSRAHHSSAAASLDAALEQGAISLERRCLVPLENPFEMGSSLQEAVLRVQAIPGLDRQFDAAFAGPRRGVSEERLGIVLASYVRGLEPPSAPYRAFLHGNPSALRGRERVGLSIFDGIGHCTACHQGENLSDGLVHLVATHDSPRIRQQKRRASLSVATNLRTMRRNMKRNAAVSGVVRRDGPNIPIRLLLSGPYGSDEPRSQTLPLWDLRRTGPYFRDGSVPNLTQAVRVHIAELRSVAKLRPQRRQPSRILPPSLRPRIPDGTPAVTPAALSNVQIGSLVAFLGTLSPRG